MYLYSMAIPPQGRCIDISGFLLPCMDCNFKWYALESFYVPSVWLFKVVSKFIVHGKIVHQARDTEPREIEATDNKIEVRIKDTSYTMRLDLATYAGSNRNRRTLG